MIKIICVCGARPNFVKIAPIVKSLKMRKKFEILLVNTGQHYDEKMSSLFFDDLDIPKPDVNLEVGSASHAVQTAMIMMGFEKIVQEFEPDYVLVVGDINSTIACGIVSAKLGVKLIHVEAGLRSFDRSMPEEINRVLTDSISDLLFVSEQSGINNLKREGVDMHKVHFVGNVMIDTLLANKVKAENSDILKQLNIANDRYAVITLHRPSNVDDTEKFNKIISAFEEIQKDIKLIFPIHPRTLKNIKGTNMEKRLRDMKNFILIDPVGYIDFLCLMINSSFIITDSGGVQEETTILGVQCMTIRENTERPITIDEGTNRLVRVNTEDIIKSYNDIKKNKIVHSCAPKLWDGKAAQRIAYCIEKDAM